MMIKMIPDKDSIDIKIAKFALLEIGDIIKPTDEYYNPNIVMPFCSVLAYCGILWQIWQFLFLCHMP